MEGCPTGARVLILHTHTHVYAMGTSMGMLEHPHHL